MRTLMVLTLIAVPSIAAAKPELKCEFEGNKATVTIVNPEAKRQFCHYTCNFQFEGGSGASTGSTGVAARETKKVDETEFRGKVTSVYNPKLECEARD